MQTTIINPVSCCGIGLHSGKIVHLTIKPAKADTGIIFIRTDIRLENNFIYAKYYNVANSSLCTSIKENNLEVKTIEHLMAALCGCGIDNAIIEIDNEEVPVMDGSSKPFIFMIEYAGKQYLQAPKRALKILKEVKVLHKDCELVAEPANDYNINLTIDFNSKIIGKQNYQFSSDKSFKEDIADARTFGFLHELEHLKSQGLARGASLENVVGIDQDKVMNPEGLRHQDEFVRHKLLDLVGDLYTVGAPIIGSFHGYKTGHALTNQFLHQLLSDSTNFRWISF